MMFTKITCGIMSRNLNSCWTVQELLEPITEKRIVDFGRGIGEKPAWLYNLPEVFSTHKYCKVPNVSARFGTDPAVWNWAMIAVARLLPKSFLADRSK